MGDETMGATQFVAFLRAINVGGRIVKMTELKKVFDSLGYADVATFIASGNVIFTSNRSAVALETEIEAALQKTLGYPVITMLRTTADVAKVAGYAAFPPNLVDGGTVYVGFMRSRATPAAVKKALALTTQVDELHVHDAEIYWLARKNLSESTITGAAIEKALQTSVTFRNINTARRLAAKYSPVTKSPSPPSRAARSRR